MCGEKHFVTAKDLLPEFRSLFLESLFQLLVVEAKKHLTVVILERG